MVAAVDSRANSGGPTWPAVAVATWGRRRAPDEHAQTRTLASVRPKLLSLALIMGPLAWIEVGGL